MEGQFGYYNLGKKTWTVSMGLHNETRLKLLEGLKAAKAASAGAVVLLEGGKNTSRHDTDHEHLFRQESFFHYLFGVREPDCYGMVEIESGKSVLFIPRLPEAYAVWMGKIQPPAHFARVYSVDECYYVDELAEVLKKKAVKIIHVLDGVNSDSGERHKGCTFPGIEHFKVAQDLLHSVLSECRVRKTSQEIALMRYACRISCEGHKEVMKSVRAGQMEYESEAKFRQVVYADGGCRHTSYTCICGSGPNSAVLHYGHAGAPNARVLQDDDILMFDMGGEYDCYGADISRSFPVSGKFSPAQREVYSVVLAAQDAVLAAMKPGVSWPAMHRLADRTICQKLKEYGFLRGDVDEMMKVFVGSLFMPHGLGHLLGIDTHDVGGYPNGMQRTQEPGLKSLRCGRALEEGMIITVEPGCYFISSVLEKAFEDEKYKPFLVKDKLQRFLGFGGIRIEDDVLVTKDGIENLSRWAPRTIAEIEALMAEGRK